MLTVIAILRRVVPLTPAGGRAPLVEQWINRRGWIEQKVPGSELHYSFPIHLDGLRPAIPPQTLRLELPRSALGAGKSRLGALMLAPAILELALQGSRLEPITVCRRATNRKGAHRIVVQHVNIWKCGVVIWLCS